MEAAFGHAAVPPSRSIPDHQTIDHATLHAGPSVHVKPGIAFQAADGGMARTASWAGALVSFQASWVSWL